jgi:AbrB family looped-hinge helix DNA binding protein
LEQKARVTSKGQFTIPTDVRRALGIRAGDSLAFEMEKDGGVRVRVVREPVSFADYAGIWREGAGMSRNEVNAHVRELRGREEHGVS